MIDFNKGDKVVFRTRCSFNGLKGVYSHFSNYSNMHIVDVDMSQMEGFEYEIAGMMFNTHELELIE